MEKVTSTLQIENEHYADQIPWSAPTVQLIEYQAQMTENVSCSIVSLAAARAGVT